jgi:hypothetical protein
LTIEQPTTPKPKDEAPKEPDVKVKPTVVVNADKQLPAKPTCDIQEEWEQYQKS